MIKRFQLKMFAEGDLALQQLFNKDIYHIYWNCGKHSYEVHVSKGFRYFRGCGLKILHSALKANTSFVG